MRGGIYAAHTPSDLFPFLPVVCFLAQQPASASLHWRLPKSTCLLYLVNQMILEKIHSPWGQPLSGDRQIKVQEFNYLSSFAPIEDNAKMHLTPVLPPLLCSYG